MHSGNYRALCYGDGNFVTRIDNSNIDAYSEYGINYIKMTIPSITKGWINVCNGNDKFVAFGV